MMSFYYDYFLLELFHLYNKSKQIVRGMYSTKRVKIKKIKKEMGYI